MLHSRQLQTLTLLKLQICIMLVLNTAIELFKRLVLAMAKMIVSVHKTLFLQDLPVPVQIVAVKFRGIIMVAH